MRGRVSVVQQSNNVLPHATYGLSADAAGGELPGPLMNASTAAMAFSRVGFGGRVGVWGWARNESGSTCGRVFGVRVKVVRVGFGAYVTSPRPVAPTPRTTLGVEELA